MKIPESIVSEWAALVRAVKPSPAWIITKHDEPIDDTEYPTEEAAGDALDELGGSPYGVAPRLLCVTVGFSPEEDGRPAGWGYQTGDNSFTGGAYGHPFWGVVWIGADSVPEEVAREIAADVESQAD